MNIYLLYPFFVFVVVFDIAIKISDLKEKKTLSEKKNNLGQFFYSDVAPFWRNFRTVDQKIRHLPARWYELSVEIGKSGDA